MHQLLTFVSHHWLLVMLTILVSFALMLELMREKGGLSSGVTVRGLTQLINDDNAVVVDLREEAQFKVGHIIGSINIPSDQLMSKIKKLNPYRNRPIVFVCERGRKAMQLISEVKKSGFESVMILTGGIAAWTAADMPLTSQSKRGV